MKRQIVFGANNQPVEDAGIKEEVKLGKEDIMDKMREDLAMNKYKMKKF